MKTVHYSEIQRLRHPWVWFLVLGVAGFNWYAFVEQILRGRPVGSSPFSNFGVLVFWAVFGILFPIFTFAMHLRIWVDPQFLYFQFFPFHLRPEKLP